MVCLLVHKVKRSTPAKRSTNMTEKTLQLLIRNWRLPDSEAVGRILAEGWRQAYSGFMPEEELRLRINPENRKAEIESWLSGEFDPDRELLLIAERDGRVVGFVGARIGDHDGLGAGGKIPLLYIASDMQRRGIGRRLLHEAAGWLKTNAPGPVVISAFEQNPFRGFYDAIGGQVAKRIEVAVGAFTWPVVLYLWPSPEALQNRVGSPFTA